MEALIIEQNIVSFLSSEHKRFYMYMSLKNDAISKGEKKKNQKNQKCLWESKSIHSPLPAIIKATQDSFKEAKPSQFTSSTQFPGAIKGLL